MAKRARGSAKRRRATIHRKPDSYLVIYKVSIFAALVIVLVAFLMALFTPLVSNTVSVLGIFTSR
ncbi:MAG: hypothetical protein A3C30_01645 [Candidatus Levybacteria bacterium RIFCSPHIGHO2_02_FULL_40_18]|nr:MAG: hypothetical protein A2869_01210 [Candidatus Levybacteria bacterium RIFCSPHIGHO2_01_FULL_40_58]OGH26696.1 MAG: hypothetical protein A3C30_01645 [Candidatus Levybacteria bacterium RIFCSPHIGHO2_02_FULL_40_18]OGH31631.1 MAG: hypothetical protein A3E43_01365 [Candidatus Levybacteria bacterium RIFCSPHIGHO2_12_FULL_40_31]OGH40259.1 MAG: hypothetical protein A2894_02380 [Candidatus Levybacteria bacterium RIFCSPLOWO2_01_FULL_40_64]OGH48707.1 MAG: hypothetical protein A3I54_03540 [Candidatus Lev